MKLILAFTIAAALILPAKAEDIGRPGGGEDHGDMVPTDWQGDWCMIPKKDGKTKSSVFGRGPCIDDVKEKVSADYMKGYEDGCTLTYGEYDKKQDIHDGIWLCKGEGSTWAARIIMASPKKGVLLMYFQLTSGIGEKLQ